MLPHTEKSLLPVLLGLDSDIDLYQSAPRLMMCGTAASVSTLLIVVGCANRPDTAGKGGLMRGFPRRPSMEFMSAVSSPQMYAPAPLWTMMSMRFPVPIAFAPRMPASYASLMA